MSFTLGNVISTIAIITSVVIATSKLLMKIQEMNFKLSLIWDWYKREHGINGKAKSE